ncbi:protein tolb [Phtheirospermum japonicum]|uniref:Protein tolb n=1 Tax=Phtheirospermum japonicum TaxID=374723 RepID=A0A830BZF5_9LAMI|nr:protein tolb [Phtheirospermum japonicum]
MHGSRKIAVATRRKGNNYRHIEIFDVDSQKFYPVTEVLNPNFHHYNPFVSPESNHLGYHRFRGESGPGDSTIPHLDPVISPIRGLRMLRLNGSFPAFSPSGDHIAFNHDFDLNSGLKIVRSDGSKRWTLFENRTAFYNSWSPADDNVIFTSIGPIFQSARAAVQIARVTFDPKHLSDNCNKIPVDIKILTKEETGNNAFPSCSPDGKSVVFRSGRSGHKNLYVIDAINGEFKDGEIRQLTQGSWIDTMPSWSPDGKLIAFSSNRHNPDNAGVFGIYTIKPDGTGVRRVGVAGFEEERERLNHVCFSADGEWLLFTANLGGVTAEPVGLPNQFQPYGDLYVVRLDGSGLQRLTWNGYENGTPAWLHPKALMVGANGEEEGDENGEEKLKGQFDEPLWIQCDF